MNLTKTLLAGVASLLLSTAANATLMMQIDGTVIIDGDLGWANSQETNSDEGAILSTYNGLGGLNLSTLGGVSYPINGSSSDPDMNLTIQASGTSSVVNGDYVATTVKLTHNFIGPISEALEFLNSSSLNGTFNGAVIEWEVFIGASAWSETQSIYDFSYDQLGGIIDTSNEGVGIGDTTFALQLDPQEFWVTQVVDIILTGDGGSIGLSTEVPEPTSIALLGLGLLGMGAARRRRSS